MNVAKTSSNKNSLTMPSLGGCAVLFAVVFMIADSKIKINLNRIDAQQFKRFNTIAMLCKCINNLTKLCLPTWRRKQFLKESDQLCQVFSRSYVNIRSKKRELINEIKPKSGMMQISSSKDEIFKLLKDIKGGSFDKRFLIEEPALVDEAIVSSYPLHSIVMSQSFSQSQQFLDDALKFLQPEVPIYFMPDDLMKRVFPTGTLPTYLAVAYTHEQRYRSVKDLSKLRGSNPFVLLENVSGPTQLGTLLNISEVFGVAGVILIHNQKEIDEAQPAENDNNKHIGGTDDQNTGQEKKRQLTPLEQLYTRQGIKASNGAFLRVPVVQTTLQEALTLFSESKFSAICVSEKTAKDIRKMQANKIENSSGEEKLSKELKKRKRYVICFSDDSKGLDKRFLKRCKVLASFPPTLKRLPVPALWSLMLHRIIHGDTIQLTPIKTKKTTSKK